MPLALLVACGPSEDVAFLESYQYRWNLFNHRVGYVEVALDEAGASVAVIGGTSTTGVVPPLPDECDQDTCMEFPFLDPSQVSVGVARVTTRRTIAREGLGLVVGASGIQELVTFDLPRTDRADAVAVITGISIDSDAPFTDGSSGCYDPANGWLPTRLRIDVGAAEREPGGQEVSVPLSARFAAGDTLESERECLDEVNEVAAVAMRVELLLVVGAETETQDLAYSQSWPTYEPDPEEQPDPTAAERPLEIDPEGRVFGWTSLDWTFHATDPDGRGAYLRSLAFVIDPEAGLASGHATNYSPGTQLSGFDYAFEGSIVGLSLGDPVREVLTGELPADLDEAGEPIVTVWPYGG
jgi:hypothetical protein